MFLRLWQEMLARRPGLPFAEKEGHGPMPNILLKLAAGAVGGALGTLLMQKSMPLAGKLPEKVKPTMPAQDPGHFMVSQGERVVGALSPKVHSGAAHGLHWAY